MWLLAEILVGYLVTACIVWPQIYYLLKKGMQIEFPESPWTPADKLADQRISTLFAIVWPLGIIITLICVYTNIRSAELNRQARDQLKDQ